MFDKRTYFRPTQPPQQTAKKSLKRLYLGGQLNHSRRHNVSAPVNQIESLLTELTGWYIFFSRAPPAMSRATE